MDSISKQLLSCGGGVSAPVNTVAPVISGSTTQGSTLSTTTGSWTNTPSSYTYQWQRNGSNIGGATGSSYTTTGTDAGANIRCVVTAVNSGGSTTANSNSIGPIVASGSVSYTTPGTYSWTVPAGVTSVCVVCVGGGGQGGGSTSFGDGGCGGGGGGLAYGNNLTVEPGSLVSVVVGAGGVGASGPGQKGVDGGLSEIQIPWRGRVWAGGGGGGEGASTGSVGGAGGYGGDLGIPFSGGAGGAADNVGGAGGGGAAGYSGAGGNGGGYTSSNSGNGGGAAGGYKSAGGYPGGGGGGVGILGTGSSGINWGDGGSGGGSGQPNASNFSAGCFGGQYGGGGSGAGPNGGNPGGAGGSGAVRIIWGLGRSYPFNAA